MPTDLTSASLRVVDPDGTLQVSPDPSTLLLDDFSAGFTQWATGGTVAPTTTSGNAAFAPGTTASATSYARTVGTFRLQAGTYLRVVHIVQVEAAAVTNSTRWWGYASQQATPTATAPLVNGTVFVLDPTAGALQAAVYSAGTKTVVATLTRPTDAAQHRYEVWYRQSVVYWAVDGVVVASRTFPNLAVATGLNVVAGSANGGTAPNTGPVLNVSSATVVDHAANNKTLSDGATPWVTQTVKQAQAPAVTAGDNPALVTALPPGSQYVTATAAAATAVTLTLPAPAAGLRHYVTGLWIERVMTAAGTASATIAVTAASNIGLVTSIPTDAAAQGTKSTVFGSIFPSPVASTAQATATSFTVPAVTATVYRVSASYYTAP